MKNLYSTFWDDIKTNELNFIDNNIINLLQDSKFAELWKYLIEINKEGYFNYLISIVFTIEHINLEKPFNSYEQEVYGNKTESDVILNISKTINQLLGSHFNEMVSKDINLACANVKDNKMWIGVNLDSFYFITLNHFQYNINENIYKNKDMELIKKKKDISLIISTLERINGVIFYTNLGKNKNNEAYPKELLDSINFTKGYIICFPYKLFDLLRQYKYARKLVLKAPEVVEKKLKTMTLLEFLDNNNFSKSIWMNSGNLTITNFEKYKIYNKKLLYKRVNTKTILSSINYLNSIKLTYSQEILNDIIKIAKNNTMFNGQLSHKTTVINYLLHIKSNNMEESQSTEITSDLQSALKSAAVLDLIEKQLEDNPTFYLNYKLDHRLRIYCYPWPINYQLNHVIRTSLKISYNPDIEEIHENFMKHPLIAKYIKNNKDIDGLLFDYIEKPEIEKIISNIFNAFNVITVNDLEEKCAKEFFYQTLLKLAPKKIKGNLEKIKFVTNKLTNFIKAEISIDFKYWLSEFKLKDKKTPYLVYYQKIIKNLLQGDFKAITWADASSNAIQLIVLRNLSNFDNEKTENLLKLVNVFDNDTEYSNIYEYLTEKIKEKDHSEIVNKLNNKISKNELISLQENDNNKYLLMPLVYGMGKISYRAKIDKMISSDSRNDIWQKLEYREKNDISDYFWNSALSEIEKLGFDMQGYKKICNESEDFDKYDAFIWQTDLGIPIAPVNIINSKRGLIKDEIKKIKIKEKLEKIKEIDKERLEKLKKKLDKDDKIFWHRHRTITDKNNIYSRIYYKKKYDISKRDTRQSIIPNTIHAYDASIMHIVIQICKKLKINILVIHDSIGTHALLLPHVKIIFKIVNILLIEINNNKKIFPFKKAKKIPENELDKVKIRILKSKNFFK